MTIEERINDLARQLSNLQNAFLHSQNNNTSILSNRIEPSYNKIPEINKNTSGIQENSNGILDLAELSDENDSAIEDIAILSDENSSAIEDLAELIDDLEERVKALEEKE